ncbi:nitrate- and nitrite sensing domain-containing protein [Thiosocius teredinicola]|uniref:nitrate- and nitrite sensing domain-containing protein n=1 Tax=Thiosocius teredinicola TaxID=1973002 RepID=UPI00099129CA
MAKVFFKERTKALASEVGQRVFEWTHPSATRRQRAVEICLVALNLMQDLQLHRGLSGAVLDGESAFNSELDATEHKLQRSLYALASHYGEKHPVFRSPQWRIVLGRWESLRNNWRDLDFYTNLEVHGDVIIGMVGILKVLATDNAKLLGAEKAEILKEWPRLMEHLGILRAWGLHLLARNGEAEERVIKTMQVSRSAAGQIMKDVADTVPDPSALSLTRDALLHARAIIENPGNGTEPQSYYAQMTVVIDRWYGMIRACLQVEDETLYPWQKRTTTQSMPVKAG